MKVINFFGGPGAGKSTAAAGLFYEMKKLWLNAELVTEFAKELVWSGSAHLLSDQNFVFAQQEHRLSRLSDKIDIAISDSPLILSAFYAPEDYPISFKQAVFDFFSMYDNVNILVRRSHHYAAPGRLQNEEESDSLAASMEEFLQANGIPYYAITASDTNPRYLIHWLCEELLIELPDNSPGFTPDDVPPRGWIQPVHVRRRLPDGSFVPTADAVAQRYIANGVRTS